jgi:uncharacterized DUF497 family protein
MDSFEWDFAKAFSNERKHGVTFEEAATIFESIHTKFFDDTSHSIHEQREIALGYSQSNQLLTVVFAVRGTMTRIISARKSTKEERKIYERSDKQ